MCLTLPAGTFEDGELQLGQGKRHLSCSLPSRDRLARGLQWEKGNRLQERPRPKNRGVGHGWWDSSAAPSAALDAKSTGHRRVSARTGSCVSKPAPLIGPAENLGLLTRAECHTNEAVPLGRLLCRALPRARQVLRSPQPPPPCAAPRRADKLSLLPAPTAKRALTAKQVPIGSRSFVIPKLHSLTTSQSQTCFTFCRLPWSRQGDAL